MPNTRTLSAEDLRRQGLLRMYGGGLSEALRASRPTEDQMRHQSTLDALRNTTAMLGQREPREPQTVRDLASDTLRFQCEGDSSLLAEVERCYNILQGFPAPQDRTPQQVDSLVIALTEEVATVVRNSQPESLEDRERGRERGRERDRERDRGIGRGIGRGRDEVPLWV